MRIEFLVAATSASMVALPVHRETRTILEPISKSLQQDKSARELDKAEEVHRVILPAYQEPPLPLQPGEKSLDDPASPVAAQSSPILCLPLLTIGAVRRDHLHTFFSQLLVEFVAVVRAITDQVPLQEGSHAARGV